MNKEKKDKQKEIHSIHSKEINNTLRISLIIKNLYTNTRENNNINKEIDSIKMSRVILLG